MISHCFNLKCQLILNIPKEKPDYFSVIKNQATGTQHNVRTHSLLWDEFQKHYKIKLSASNEIEGEKHGLVVVQRLRNLIITI